MIPSPSCRLAPALLLSLLALAGCQTMKALPQARMQLPVEMSGDAAARTLEDLPLRGIGGQSRGEFRAGEAGGRFERSASRLALFDAALGFDRASARFTWQPPAGTPQEADCQARRAEVQRSLLSLPARPWHVACTWSQGARLTMDAEPLAAAGTQESRRGRFEGGGVTLALQSVHRLQGTPLPLTQAAGYLISFQGVPVAALELTGVTPRLLRPREPGPLQDAVTQAALALALLWDPASL